jgi:hypothetical protein
LQKIWDLNGTSICWKKEKTHEDYLRECAEGNAVGETLHYLREGTVLGKFATKDCRIAINRGISEITDLGQINTYDSLDKWAKTEEERQRQEKQRKAEIEEARAQRISWRALVRSGA